VLDGTFNNTVYSTTVLTQPTTITFNSVGAVPGASNFLRLVGNGVTANTLTVGAGCQLLTGTDEFDTTSGRVNTIQCVFDGVDNWVTMGTSLITVPSVVPVVPVVPGGTVSQTSNILAQSSTSGLVYTRSGTAPFTYTLTAAPASNNLASNSMVLSPVANGDYEVVIAPTATHYGFINAAMRASATPLSYNTLRGNAADQYFQLGGGVLNGFTSSVVAANFAGATNPDWLRLKRVGNILSQQSSRDNGVTWVPFTGTPSDAAQAASTGAVYLHITLRDLNASFTIRDLVGFS
jgi:hypothetical protein